MLRLLLPVTCAGCGGASGPICPTCESLLVPAPPSPPPSGLDEHLAVLSYEGAGRDVVLGFKYAGCRSVADRLAPPMAQLVRTWQPDVVTWAPTTPARRRARGFDPAEVLARAVARHLDRPVRRLLHRRPGPAQTGRSLVERTARPPGFDARAGVVGRRVVVVDDVLTTGATLGSAGRALCRAGAVTVLGLTAARTP